MKSITTLASVNQLVGHSIPSQGTYMGYEFNSQSSHV